jgi:lysophospholipase L1-like esterase
MHMASIPSATTKSWPLTHSQLTNGTQQVRVLFYGQSITEQKWTEQVSDWLKNAYPSVQFVIENRAIGGHSSQILWKTAEADLYPFQPDLLIFHVYGDADDYERIIRNTLTRTTADVVIQTDHLAAKDALIAPTGSFNPKENWTEWWNTQFLPDLARKLPITLLDVRTPWRKAAQAQPNQARSFLTDDVHLNDRGCDLMASIIIDGLKELVKKAQPKSSKVIETPLNWVGDHAILDFQGSRIDVVGSRPSELQVEIDDIPVENHPDLMTKTRTTPFPDSNWPLILRTSHDRPLLAEDWTITLQNIDPTGTAGSFSVKGSVTGEDGNGCIDKTFRSSSGRVIIQPDDWNLGYCVRVFKKPVPDNSQVKFQVIHQFETKTSKLATDCTLFQGLTNAHHKLKLTLKSPNKPSSVRIFRPPLSQSKS